MKETSLKEYKEEIDRMYDSLSIKRADTMGIRLHFEEGNPIIEAING